MKKIILGVVSLATIAVVNAQSGTVLVGGNVDYSSNKDEFGNGDSESRSSFEFSPTLGYQFNDNWTAGIVGSLNTTKNAYPNSDILEGLPGTTYVENVKTTRLGIGPFIRYSQSISDIFAVYGQLQGQYRSAKSKIDGENDPDYEQNGFHVGFFPAVFINVSEGFGLNFNIGGVSYNSMEFKESKDKTSNFNVNFGRTFGIGISKNF